MLYNCHVSLLCHITFPEIVLFIAISLPLITVRGPALSLLNYCHVSQLYHCHIAIFPGCHITFPGIVLFIAISLPFNCYKGNNKRACHFIAKSLPCFPAISLPYCHIFRMSSSHCPISLLISLLER